MKFLLTAIFFLFALGLYADTVTISGHINGSGYEIRLASSDGKTSEITIDSANRFSHAFETDRNSCTYLLIINPSNPHSTITQPLFIANGTSTINVNINPAKSSLIFDDNSNNAISYFTNTYLPQLAHNNRPITDILNSITNGSDSISATLTDNDARNFLQYLGHINRTILTANIRKNGIKIPAEALNGYKSARELTKMPGLKYFRHETLPLVLEEIAIGASPDSRLQRVKQTVSDSLIILMAAQAIEEQERLERYSRIGGEMPPVAITDISGNKHFLSEFKGKYIYVDIWASWCGPCNREIPYLRELEKTLGNDKVEFVAISIDEDINAWKAAVKRHNLKGNQFIGNDSLATMLKIQGIPRYLIYDPDGRLLNTDAPRPSSGMEIRRLLNSLQ